MQIAEELFSQNTEVKYLSLNKLKDLLLILIKNPFFLEFCFYRFRNNVFRSYNPERARQDINNKRS